MEKVLFCEKDFLDEQGRKNKLAYWLLIQPAKKEKAYGVAVERHDDAGGCERDAVEGLTGEREEAEQFLRRLSHADALPVELAALCDDFISEREWAEEREGALAVS